MPSALARLCVATSFAITAFASAPSSIAAGPPDGLNVTVVNSAQQPVPVTVQGSSSVTGNVAVTNTSANPVPVTGTVAISSSANGVSIVGNASVTSADRTAPVSSGRITFSSGVSALTPPRDLTEYKTVKLVITSPTGPGTSQMQARVYETRGSTFMLIDVFAVPDNFTGAVRFYDMPGQAFSVEIINNNPGSDQTYEYVLLGRRN